MFNFCMSTDENFASFNDGDTGRVVYVDSFDNREFNVRFGTISKTIDLGTVEAETDEALNQRLRELVDSCEKDNDNHGHRHKFV